MFNWRCVHYALRRSLCVSVCADGDLLESRLFRHAINHIDVKQWQRRFRRVSDDNAYIMDSHVPCSSCKMIHESTPAPMMQNCRLQTVIRRRNKHPNRTAVRLLYQTQFYSFNRTNGRPSAFVSISLEMNISACQRVDCARSGMQIIFHWTSNEYIIFGRIFNCIQISRNFSMSRNFLTQWARTQTICCPCEIPPSSPQTDSKEKRKQKKPREKHSNCVRMIVINTNASSKWIRKEQNIENGKNALQFNDFWCWLHCANAPNCALRKLHHQ